MKIEKPSCDDCISRQAVLDTMSELNAISFYEAQEDSKECYHEIKKAIEALPPVTPTHKTGHWIKMPLVEAGQTYSHMCSLCGRRILVTDVGLSEFPYCHCGAEMESEVEE